MNWELVKLSGIIYYFLPIFLIGFGIFLLVSALRGKIRKIYVLISIAMITIGLWQGVFREVRGKDTVIER